MMAAKKKPSRRTEPPEEPKPAQQPTGVGEQPSEGPTRPVDAAHVQLKPKRQGQLLDTGIEGLNDILHGGLPPNRLYLVEGNPGSGKTTLALQFLLAGVRRGEPCLFVTLSESEEELKTSAAAHGWSLEGIRVLELIASEESLEPDARYTMFHPSEVELTRTIRVVLEETRRLKPRRVVFDSLAELRLLAESPLRYRRQVLALKQFFSPQQCTVLLIDDRTGEDRDQQLQTIANGVLSLEAGLPDYGRMRRRLHVAKLRGTDFREGYHDYVIRQAGLEVFPRLVAAEHRTVHSSEVVKSGLEPLDALLGGGLARGTSTLMIGAAGTGKSSLATQFAITAGRRQEHAALFLFDESVATFLKRSDGLGMGATAMVASGQLSVRQIDAAELSVGEFAHVIRRSVEQKNTRLVVIDSVNGYLNAMPEQRSLKLHLHELLAYLGELDVTTLLVMCQHGVMGENYETPVDVTYLADTVLLLRYFEAAGEIRQAISVIKKRTGKHERTIRDLAFQDAGIMIGQPLREFRGIMTGTPQYVGTAYPGEKPSTYPHGNRE